jgi:hypothetical protein
MIDRLAKKAGQQAWRFLLTGRHLANGFTAVCGAGGLPVGLRFLRPISNRQLSQ